MDTHSLGPSWIELKTRAISTIASKRHHLRLIPRKATLITGLKLRFQTKSTPKRSRKSPENDDHLSICRAIPHLDHPLCAAQGRASGRPAMVARFNEWPLTDNIAGARPLSYRLSLAFVLNSFTSSNRAVARRSASTILTASTLGQRSTQARCATHNSPTMGPPSPKDRGVRNGYCGALVLWLVGIGHDSRTLLRNGQQSDIPAAVRTVEALARRGTLAANRRRRRT